MERHNIYSYSDTWRDGYIADEKLNNRLLVAWEIYNLLLSSCDEDESVGVEDKSEGDGEVKDGKIDEVESPGCVSGIINFNKFCKGIVTFRKFYEKMITYLPEHNA